MRRRHYLLFAVVLLSGIAGSVMVLPSSSELGLMRLKDKQFGTARSIYEKRIAGGDYSVDAVMPLVEIYMQYGETERAVVLLEKFATISQASPDLMAAVGRVKRSAQKPAEYMQALEDRAALKTDRVGMRELASLYRYFDRREGLLRVLGKLADSGAATAAELFELSQLRAAAGDPGSALHSLGKLERLLGNDIDDDSVELAIRLLLDTGKPDQAFRRAETYLKRHKNPHVARTFAAVFAVSGMPQAGYRVLQILPQFLHDPDYLKEWVEYEVRLGMRELAWKRLEERYRKQSLEEQLLSSFMDLALERKRFDDAFSVGMAHRFTAVPDWLLANLTEAAFDRDSRKQVDMILSTAGSEFLFQRPLLGARIWLQKRDPVRAARYLAAARQTSDHTERLVLADMHLSINQPSEARAILASTRFEAVDNSALSAISDAYTRLNAASEGASRLEALGASSPQHKLYFPWLLLTLTAGHDNAALQSLRSAGHSRILPAQWRDVYYVASDHKCLGTAVHAAERLVASTPSDETRELLGQVLLAAGRNEEALAILRGLRHKSTEAADNYVAALLAAVGPRPAEAHPNLQAELRQYWMSLLNNPARARDALYGLLELKDWATVLPLLERMAAGADAEILSVYLETCGKAAQPERARQFVRQRLDAQRAGTPGYEDLVWWLIESSGKPAAERYILALAETGKETWIEAAAELLIEAKRVDEARTFLTAKSSLPGLSSAAHLRMVYQLLSLGAVPPAAELLFRQVGTAGPDDTRVRDLVELWRNNPQLQNATWLADRARHSNGEAKAQWLRHLLVLNAPELALGLVIRPVDEPLPVLEAALEAATLIKGRTEIERIAQVLLQRFPALSALRAAAVALSDRGSLEMAETAWSRVLRYDGKDADALRWLASQAASRGRTQEALSLFARLEELPDDDPSSALAHAELLREAGELLHARERYSDAVRLSGMRNAPEIAGVRAYAFFRLGRTAEAFSRFEQLRKAGQLGPDLRADYASLLLEHGRSREALDLLATRPKSAEWHTRSRLLEAEILAQEYEGQKALEHLHRTMDHSGREPRTLAVAASVEERRGRHRSALGYIDEAAHKDPASHTVAESRSRLRALNASRVTAQTEHRSISGLQDQLWTRLEGSTMITGAMGLLFGMHHVRYSDASRPGNATSRQFGEAGLTWKLMNGMHLQASASSTGSNAGAAVVFSIPDERGRTDIRAEYGKPYWEVAELLSSGGVRDAVEVERSYSLDSGMVLRANAAARQYRDPAANASARTVALTGIVQQPVVPGGNVSLDYIVDWERLRSTGAPAAGLMSSREVHSGALSAHKTLSRKWELNASLGIAADRLGGRGPFWTADAAYQAKRGFRFEVFMDRRRYRQATDRDATRVGGGLTWRF